MAKLFAIISRGHLFSFFQMHLTRINLQLVIIRKNDSNPMVRNKIDFMVMGDNLSRNK
jgi:hypothetical protein